MDINFTLLKAEVFTAIRAEWPVEKLQEMSKLNISPTPVSGDALTRLKAELRESRS